jgi:hypothetical protein
MIGIGIPSFGPVTSAGDGSVWPGVVAAIVLVAVLAATIWTCVRNRPAHLDDPQEDSVALMAA